MKPRKRISFSKIPSILALPDLLAVQLDSFRSFLQASAPPDKREDMGLQAVFNAIFPIVDSSKISDDDLLFRFLIAKQWKVDDALKGLGGDLFNKNKK